jgi:ElaB/YqjD/DUF883 family membrane-anchored ribosome-binding protein
MSPSIDPQDTDTRRTGEKIMIQIIPQTHEEKVEMYMKQDKRKIAEMLANCNEMIDLLLPVAPVAEMKIQPEPRDLTDEEKLFVSSLGWNEYGTRILLSADLDSIMEFSVKSMRQLWDNLRASQQEVERLKKKCEQMGDEICGECGQGIMTSSCDSAKEICLVCAAREDFQKWQKEKASLKSDKEKLEKEVETINDNWQGLYNARIEQANEDLASLRSSLEQARKVIREKWYRTDDRITIKELDAGVCVFCGEDAIPNSCVHKPDCIVLKSEGK